MPAAAPPCSLSQTHASPAHQHTDTRELRAHKTHHMCAYATDTNTHKARHLEDRARRRRHADTQAHALEGAHATFSEGCVQTLKSTVHTPGVGELTPRPPSPLQHPSPPHTSSLTAYASLVLALSCSLPAYESITCPGATGPRRSSSSSSSSIATCCQSTLSLSSLSFARSTPCSVVNVHAGRALQPPFLIASMRVCWQGLCVCM